jgi:AcrR family transcriptional regulator
MCYRADVAPKSTAPDPASRHPGRPRRSDVEAVVLDAAIELLSERGIDGTTMSAVVERSGVARATVYLRWPTRHALILAAVRRSMGRPIVDSTNDVEADLRRGSDRLAEVLDSPSFRGVFPALVASLTRQGGGAEAPISFFAIAPGMHVILNVYRDYAAQQGFRPEVEPEVVLDLLLGSHLGHYLIRGRPPTAIEREQMLEAILDGLRAREPAAS